VGIAKNPIATGGRVRTVWMEDGSDLPLEISSAHRNQIKRTFERFDGRSRGDLVVRVSLACPFLPGIQPVFGLAMETPPRWPVLVEAKTDYSSRLSLISSPRFRSRSITISQSRAHSSLANVTPS
jgi:hypothetical protein